MTHQATTARYAVLIGIDAYPDNPLKGCVRDVNEIKTQLLLKFPAMHMQTFTASLPNDSTTTVLFENPESWPTYHNILSSLDWVAFDAKLGDSVYIHFSGHGASLPRHSESFDSDLALVVLEIHEIVSVRYLRGLQLARRLKRMAEKGLKVTLVLDCCESGSVMRGDDDLAVRSIAYNASVDAMYPMQDEGMIQFDNDKDTSTHRTASLRPNWLVDPHGYTILTACGPTERAQEIQLNISGERHGALSYFLLNAFARLDGAEVKSQHMYYHLCARFRETRHMRQNEQNPMFYGNRDFSFFGENNEVETDRVASPVLLTTDRRLQLQVGKAHGICDGDRFAIRPLGYSSATATPERPTVIATVTTVGPLKSYVEAQNTPSLTPASGWIATPLTQFSLRQFPVELKMNIPISKEWEDAVRDKESLLLFTSHREGRNSPCSFSVTPASDHSYEVQDEFSQDVFHVPSAQNGTWSTENNVLDLVEHLARFRFVHMLTNELQADPEHFFSNLFTIELVDSSQRSHRPGCQLEDLSNQVCLHDECAIDVKDKELVTLVIQSTGMPRSGDTYVHLYDADSDWAVENILEANYLVIPPRQTTWRQLVWLEVPDKTKEAGQLFCEDTIKIFLTNSPTSFMSMELPKLAKKAIGNQRVQASRGVTSSLDEWAVYNFRVRTHVS